MTELGKDHQAFWSTQLVKGHFLGLRRNPGNSEGGFQKEIIPWSSKQLKLIPAPALLFQHQEPRGLARIMNTGVNFIRESR